MKNFIPPCPKCPYKLGLVHTLVNPCPACKKDDYNMFKVFTEKYTRTEEIPEGK